MTPEELGIPQEQYSNLEKLAYLLETVDEDEFDMGCHAIDVGGELINPNQSYRAECGTVACAAGHLVKIAKPLMGEGWAELTSRVVGIEYGNRNWAWLFHEGWEGADNTALGASKRIRYLLEKGAPENWEDQMLGDAPLCY